MRGVHVLDNGAGEGDAGLGRVRRDGLAEEGGAALGTVVVERPGLVHVDDDAGVKLAQGLDDLAGHHAPSACRWGRRGRSG